MNLAEINQVGSHNMGFKKNQFFEIKIIIYGAGGHGATVSDALLGSKYRVVGFLDDDQAKQGAIVFPGIEVIGTGIDIKKIMQMQTVTAGVLGIGGVVDSLPRIKAFQLLKEHGLLLPPVIHANAIVSPSAIIGEGTVILGGAVVGPRCNIGANVIVNQGVQICHDAVIKDHVHLAPGAIIAGDCVIGESAIIGMGSCIKQGITIEEHSLLGMGSVVTQSITESNCLVYGAPAKIIKKLDDIRAC